MVDVDAGALRRFWRVVEEGDLEEELKDVVPVEGTKG